MDLETEGNLGWHLGVLLRAYQATVGPVVAEFPHATRGYQILTTVVEGKQPTQLALAAHLGIDRTAMTYVIDDLVMAGLVERQQNPADRRARKVVATAEGEAALARLEHEVHAAEERLFGALSSADREAFRALLGQIACSVRDIEPLVDPCDAAANAAL